jgi:hypothetical protein
MPIDCELSKGDIWVNYSSPENGEEYEISLGKKTISELEGWASYVDEHHLMEEYESYEGQQFWEDYKSDN